jgi:hypothetical protein
LSDARALGKQCPSVCRSFRRHTNVVTEILMEAPIVNYERWIRRPLSLRFWASFASCRPQCAAFAAGVRSGRRSHRSFGCRQRRSLC